MTETVRAPKAICLVAVLSILGCGRSSAPLEHPSDPLPSAQRGYRCGPERMPLVVSYWNETDPPTAVLDYQGRRVTVFQQPVASGARYATDASPEPTTEFWEHHGDATFKWFGVELDCRRLPDEREAL